MKNSTLNANLQILKSHSFSQTTTAQCRGPKRNEKFIIHYSSKTVGKYVYNMPIYYTILLKNELPTFSYIVYVQYRSELVWCPFETFLLYKYFLENYFREWSCFQSQEHIRRLKQKLFFSILKSP